MNRLVKLVVVFVGGVVVLVLLKQWLSKEATLPSSTDESPIRVSSYKETERMPPIVLPPEAFEDIDVPEEVEQ